MPFALDKTYLPDNLSICLIQDNSHNKYNELGAICSSKIIYGRNGWCCSSHTHRCSQVGDGHSHGQPGAASRASQGSSIHCSWEAHPDVCHSPAGHAETDQSCDTILVSIFSVLFQFSAKVFPAFQVLWWLWPGEGGRLGKAVGEDVAGPIARGTWRWTRSHTGGKDSIVSPDRDDVLFLPGKAKC